MLRNKVLPVFIATILICGCATLQGLVQEPEIEVVGMTLKNISLFKATPVFKVRITNPNSVDITVEKVTYHIKIKDKKVGEGFWDQEIILAAGGSELLEVPVSISYADMFKAVPDLFRSDKVAYELSGTVMVGPFSVPYRSTGYIDIPKLPTILLEHIGISDFSFTGCSMLIRISMENSNPFSVKPDELSYSIKLGGTELAKGVTKKFSLGKHSASTLEVPLTVNFLEIGRSFYNMLTGNSAEYELSGTMKFHTPEEGEKFFSFRETGKIPLFFSLPKK
ncbi:MAG: hypothetical protein DRI57_29940 [Deltaproteobacteria bacterium]|nr:MAG: hypothetical protein DRI57_29940 [Deltaproteobacteria bacterium]